MELLATLAAPAFNVKLELFYNGSEKLDYKMTIHETALFEGGDYRPSPLIAIDSIDSALGLLAFLTAQPADTDPEYFADYTKAQLLWANSHDCEQLKNLVQDAGNSDEPEYQAAALEYFEFTSA